MRMLQRTIVPDTFSLLNRLVAVTVTMLGLFASIAASARAEVTAEQVRAAIDRGARYLLAQQRDDGSWPDAIDIVGRRSGYAPQAGGVTALCTLALLNAGIEPNDRHMQKALNCLQKVEPDKTYVVSLQTMVFARADPKKYVALITRNVEWLQKDAGCRRQVQGGVDLPDPRQRPQ